MSRQATGGTDRPFRIPPGWHVPLILVGFLLILVVALVVFGREAPPEREPGEPIAEIDREEETPGARCAADSTYALLKRELFRRAAELRGSDQAAYDRLSAYSALRVDRPVAVSQSSDLGIAGCRATIILDLPPGVEVVGGRRSLSASVQYSLQTAADDSGEVIAITGDEGITVPLATLVRTGAGPRPRGQERADELADPLAPVETPATDDPPAPSQPAPQPSASSGVEPSFSCRHAKTRGEVAVCRDPMLAALDRQMAAQYSRAFGRADERQRALLNQTRMRFLGFRDSCRDDDCIAESYRGRMREIADILADRWQPPR